MARVDRDRFVSISISVVVILLIEILVHRVEALFEPTSFALLSTFQKAEPSRAFIAVVDISDLTSKIPPGDSLPGSGIIDILEQINEALADQGHPLIIGVDADFAAGRPTGVDARDEKPGGSVIDLRGTFVSHQEVVAKSLEICPSSESKTKVVLGVGPSAFDSLSAFSRINVGGREIQPDSLAHLAGSIVTTNDPRAMPLGLSRPERLDHPLLSFGEKIAQYCEQRLPGEIPVSEIWVHALDRQFSQKYGASSPPFDWRYVGYSWLKEAEKRTYRADGSASMDPTAQNLPPGQSIKYGCRLPKTELDRLSSELKAFRSFPGRGLAPAIVLIGDAPSARNLDVFPLQKIMFQEDEETPDSGTLVPGNAAVFPGIYQHACYIDTVLNSPIRRLGVPYEKLASLLIALLTALGVSYSEEPLEEPAIWHRALVAAAWFAIGYTIWVLTGSLLVSVLGLSMLAAGVLAKTPIVQGFKRIAALLGFLALLSAAIWHWDKTLWGVWTSVLALAWLTAGRFAGQKIGPCVLRATHSTPRTLSPEEIKAETHRGEHRRREILGRVVRLGIACVIFLLAWLLAKHGWLWSGFLASLLFLLLEPYLCAFLEVFERWGRQIARSF